MKPKKQWDPTNRIRFPKPVQEVEARDEIGNEYGGRSPFAVAEDGDGSRAYFLSNEHGVWYRIHRHDYDTLVEWYGPGHSDLVVTHDSMPGSGDNEEVAVSFARNPNGTKLVIKTLTFNCEEGEA